jgi:hypothetical protein
MICSYRITLLVLLGIASLSCPTTATSARGEDAFSIPDLGFSYMPPIGMTDRTSGSAREARKHALANNKLNLILDMASNEVDTAPNWHQLWIFIRPRTQIANPTDSVAEAKTNTALAGPRAIPVGAPRNAVLAGRNFVVSEFQQSEPPLLKHAIIYSTSYKGQLLTLVFVSNSGAQVSAMEESLKSLKISSH